MTLVIVATMAKDAGSAAHAEPEPEEANPLAQHADRRRAVEMVVRNLLSAH